MDLKKEIKWQLRQAQGLFDGWEQGVAEAQKNLGYIYEKGYGVSQNYRQALSWYLKAADQGLADAQNKLGDMYKDGRGVGQNNFEAFGWYFKAAEQGLAEAQNKLGNCFISGKGVVEDYSEAAKWYRKAADQGLADAQNKLKYLHEHGYSVGKDSSDVLKWDNKAKDQGGAISTYTFNSQAVVFKTLEGLRNFVEIFIKTRDAPGGPSETAIKTGFLDIAQDRAYMVGEGTECILLEDRALMDGIISTIFIKGRGLGYISKSQISPKLK